MSSEQPAPTPNGNTPVWQLVLQDMRARDNVGRQRYGTPLQAFNGRDALRDAYEEALDMVVYLRQAMEERDTIMAAIHELRLAVKATLDSGPDLGDSSQRGYLESTFIKTTRILDGQPPGRPAAKHPLTDKLQRVVEELFDQTVTITDEAKRQQLASLGQRLSSLLAQLT